MHSWVWWSLHLFEYRESRLVAGFQLQNMSKMKCSLLEMAIRLQNLTKLEMLLPSILIRWLDLKGPSSEEDGIIQILEVEKDTCQVQKYFSIIWWHSQSPTETLNAGLRIPLDPPKICNLIIDLNTLWFFSFRFLKPSLNGVNINI